MVVKARNRLRATRRSYRNGRRPCMLPAARKFTSLGLLETGGFRKFFVMRSQSFSGRWARVSSGWAEEASAERRGSGLGSVFRS